MADRTEPLLGNETVVGGAAGTQAIDGSPGNQLFFRDETVSFTATSGARYQIDFGVMIGEGGEGGIFDATDEQGATFVAKVYPVPDDPREWADHRQVIESLEEYTQGGIARCKSTHLMPLFAHGILRYDGRDYVVLILPYCTCLGDLPVKPNMLKGTVIPAVATALKFLHERNFVHRDVKPSNIFRYEDVVVLGDFGISTIFKPGEENRATMRRRGTEGYVPGTLVVNLQLDWYSFGYTIWTMYNDNVHPHQRLIDLGSMADVWAGKRPVPFQLRSQADAGLRSLVYGLVDEHADRRFGYDEVMRWRSDPAGFAAWCDRQRPAAEGRAGWGRPYRFNSTTCTDGPQLAAELAGGWDDALQHLYEGELADHFRAVGDQTTSTKLREIVRDEGGAHQDRGLAKAIFLISGDNRLLAWQGSPLSLDTVRHTLSTNCNDSRYDEMFREGVLSWYLEQVRGTTGFDAADVDAILPTLRFVEGLAGGEGHPRLARLVYLHCFADGEGTKYPAQKSVDQLAHAVLGTPGNLNPSRLYDLAASATSREDLIAALSPHLARIGTLDEVGRLAGEFGSRLSSDGKRLRSFANQYLLLLDKLAHGCAAAREFAVTYGPQAPWFWVGHHTDLYAVQDAPHADEARAALKGAAASLPQANASVSDIQRQGTAALRHCDVMRGSMDDSPAAAYAGVRTNKPLVACCDDALFCSSFFGEKVPRGFVRAYLQASKAQTGQDASTGSAPTSTDPAPVTRGLLGFFSKGMAVDAQGAAQNQVQLLSTEALGSTSYLAFAHDRCDEVADAARQLKESVSSRSVALSVTASTLGIVVLIAGPLLFARLVDVSLSDMPAYGRYILFGPSLVGALFLLVDAINALRMLRAPATGTSVEQHVQQLRTSLDGQAAAFRAGGADTTSAWAQSLRDVTQNQPHGSFDFSQALETQQRRIKGVSSPASSLLYRIYWRLSVIVTSSVMLIYVLGFMFAPKNGYGFFEDIFLLFVDLAMFFIAWIPGVGAVLLYRSWRQNASDDRIYSAIGFILTIAMVLCAAYTAIWYGTLPFRV